MSERKPTFTVGPIPVYGDLILSPMDGFSDLPFRSLARRLGSAMSYTEFVNAIDVIQGSPRLAPRLAYDPSERPVVFQVFDDDPDRLVSTAQKLLAFEPDIIDVNMGCSAKNVSGRGAGAGLLRTPEKIARIFAELTRQINIPITGKIRLGWDETTRNYLEIARIVEDNGGQLLAVHGRTKKQGYSGQADWDAIAEVKQAVKIPVIANGDVRTVEDIDRVKRHTGCDGVMIARAAIGNPWIFSRKDRADVPVDQVRQTMLAHLAAMQSFYGVDEGLVLFRKHASRYISPYPLDRDLRARLLTSETAADFVALLDEIMLRAYALPAVA